MILQNIRSKIFLVLFLMPLEIFGRSSQLKTAITVTDSSNHATVIEFGVDPAATDCIDPSLGEFELPPGGCTGSGLCIAFKDHRSDSTACLGEGLLLDLRKHYSPAQVDTYRVVYNFQNYPVVFRWSPVLGMSYDSVKFLDELGGLVVNINMAEVDSMVMASPLVSSLFIIAWGPKLISTSSEIDAWQYPPTAQLYQNYPNPFNPTTVIRYHLPAGQAGLPSVSLRVYNLLGQQVAELVNEMPAPGYKSVEWNASSLPSGLYYYRLLTGQSTETRRMLLVK